MNISGTNEFQTMDVSLQTLDKEASNRNYCTAQNSRSSKLNGKSPRKYTQRRGEKELKRRINDLEAQGIQNDKEKFYSRRFVNFLTNWQREDQTNIIGRQDEREN